jgi:hypothetical protein
MTQITLHDARKSGLVRAFAGISDSATLRFCWVDIETGNEVVTLMLPAERFENARLLADFINDHFNGEKGYD